MLVMLSPIATTLAADFEVAANTRPVLVVLALSRLHIKPKAGTIQVTAFRLLVLVDELQQLLLDIVRHGVPVNRVKRLTRWIHKRRIAHVHTTDAAPSTVINNREFSGLVHEQYR